MSLMKKYKLVPLNVFEKMVNSKQNCSVEQNCSDEQSNERTIQDIITSESSDTDNSHFKGSKHYVAEFKKQPNQELQQNIIGKGSTSDPKNNNNDNMSGEGLSNNTPGFTHDSSTLPEFSLGKKNFNDVSSILNDQTIPENFKLKLYLILRNKYEKSRKDTDLPDIYDSDDTDNAAILSKVIDDLPNSKSAHGTKLGNILSESKHIHWDHMGNIIAPHVTGAHKFDLHKLLKHALYQNHGTKSDLLVLSEILKPNITELMKQRVILNDKLLTTPNFTGYSTEAKLSKYVSW